MRVLLSGLYLGGAGGTERAMHGMLHALSSDSVDTVVSHTLGGEWSDIPRSVRIHSRKSWRWIAPSRPVGRLFLNPIRRALSECYDVAIMQRWAPDVISTSRSRLRLVIPSGNSLKNFPVKFDFVAMQAPDNVKFLEAGMPSLLLPPPLLPLSEFRLRPRHPLPPHYFLTVFNPYGVVKGSADLRRAADDSPLPIVWCHSTATLRFEIETSLQNHPNIVHIESPTAAELRYLYENCRAYLSFSLSEGFGWAIADALRYSPAVVSRPVGVLSFPEAIQAGVHLLDDTWSVDWSRFDETTATPRRNLDFLSPEQFRRRLSLASLSP